VLDRVPRRVRIAVGTLAVMGVTAGNRFGAHHDLVLVALAVAVSGAAIATPRRPVTTLAVLSAASFAFVATGQPALTPALAWATYGVSLLRPRRDALRIGAAALLVAGAGSAVRGQPLNSAFSELVVLTGAWIVGDSVRTRREQLKEKEQQAVAAERARIARELHDLVTHNVSVMVVQAGAAGEVFDEHPQQARAALAAIEETGRRALSELRRLLDVVAEEEDLAYDPQPGLRRLDELVASVRATGLGVDLTVEGSPRLLSPALELSAFRIVQEALTNVLKHARATRASVRVRFGTDTLELEVADDGVGAATTDGGRGLVGMRERAALFGGEVAAGTRPGGGFAVRARMPLEAS
jgi:signal transduction histidine kinase